MLCEITKRAGKEGGKGVKSGEVAGCECLLPFFHEELSWALGKRCSYVKVGISIIQDPDGL